MITNRPFNDLDDLEKMKKLIRQRGEFADLQPGDLVWRYYRSLDVLPKENIMLWESEANELVAFVWYYPPDSFDFVIAEGIPIVHIGKDILNWCEKRYIDFKNEKPEERPSGFLWTGSVETDEERISLLKDFDFEEGEKYFFHMVFKKGKEFERLEPSDDFSIHPVGEKIEIGEKVTAYREAFYPTDFSFESYMELRESKDYHNDLDLVVVNEEGNVGGFGTAWFDSESRSGVIEPVGIRPGFKESGLEKVIISHLLDRLLKMGCEWIIAYPRNGDKELLQAYQEVGFSSVTRNKDFYMTFIL